MSIADLPIMNMLRARMQWHQERQRLLAENVANADTPDFKPRDLAPLQFNDSLPRSAAVALARTDAAHLGGVSGGATGQFQLARTLRAESRPGSPGVNLEDEMLKVAANQMDYQAAATLY
ncbi:MAG: flagellar basal body rod protein FlgB, partial [Variibacter sp.]|nr:flagellar basal body rod protein FlgB [Variibacter sp.]